MKAAFDFGDLLYVVLTIIFIAAGAFGKKKKPVQQRPVKRIPAENGNQEVITSKGFNIDDLLKDYLGVPDIATKSETDTELYEPERAEDNTGNTEEYIPEEPVPATSLEDQGYEKYTEERAVTSEEYKSAFGPSIMESQGFEEITKSEISDEETITDQISLSEGQGVVQDGYNPELEGIVGEFDARKAFIYSEIFNRRDIA
jgi:hypothetical protein